MRGVVLRKMAVESSRCFVKEPFQPLRLNFITGSTKTTLWVCKFVVKIGAWRKGFEKEGRIVTIATPSLFWERMDMAQVVLDMGCGPKKIPGAIGVDMCAFRGVDVVWDLDK